MSDPRKKSLHCEHKSAYVELVYFRDEGLEGQLPTLQPVRDGRSPRRTSIRMAIALAQTR